MDWFDVKDGPRPAVAVAGGGGAGADAAGTVAGGGEFTLEGLEESQRAAVLHGDGPL